MEINRNFFSWGRVDRNSQKVFKPQSIDDLLNFTTNCKETILPTGFRRSYGCSGINSSGINIDMTKISGIIKFDKEKQLISCYSGTSLQDIINTILPHGFFLKVTPGSKFVSVGGAIANDVHGKNHSFEGTFGNTLQEIQILNSEGQLLTCNKNKNRDLFFSTIGGMGLTGIIIEATFEIKQIQSFYLDQEIIFFDGIDDFVIKSEHAQVNYEYVVGWIDCFSKKHKGFMSCANFASDMNFKTQRRLNLRVPFELPKFILNKFSISLFNKAYYLLALLGPRKSKVYYDTFFYPLDSIKDWNLMYGKDGFFQYQFVLPVEKAFAVKNILNLINSSSIGSFLAVIKLFGKKDSFGELSFPREGITLALDFQNVPNKVGPLFTKIDEIIKENGGRIYPAKYSTAAAMDLFCATTQLEKFLKYKDKMHNSDFWSMK